MKTAIKIGMMGLSIVLLAGCKEKSHQTEMPAPVSYTHLTLPTN